MLNFLRFVCLRVLQNTLRLFFTFFMHEHKRYQVTCTWFDESKSLFLGYTLILTSIRMDERQRILMILFDYLYFLFHQIHMIWAVYEDMHIANYKYYKQTKGRYRNLPAHEPHANMCINVFGCSTFSYCGFHFPLLFFNFKTTRNQLVVKQRWLLSALNHDHCWINENLGAVPIPSGTHQSLPSHM